MLAVGVIYVEVAEESGLRFDLCAVADDNDLYVGGVEISSRGSKQIVRRERTDFLAIGLEVIVGEFVERHGSELREQAVLRGEPEREHAADIIARVCQFRLRDRKGPKPV